MTTTHDIFADVPGFLDRIFVHITSDNIDVSSYILDHICYRVETMTEYESMKLLFQERWTLLIENIIWWRPIATYNLYEPIGYKDRTIHTIELPSPKEWSQYPTGWEHAEFAVGEDWWSLMEIYPTVNWDTRSMWKAINPELSRKYSDWLSIKFHEHPLDYIIATYEK